MRVPTKQNKRDTVIFSILLLFLTTPLSASTNYPIPPNLKELLPDNKFCGEKAITLWECNLPKKTMVLCLQRQGTGLERVSLSEANSQGTIEEIARGHQPGVHMNYENTANGDASLEITTPAAIYTLIDPIRDLSEWEVTPAGPKRTQHYICKYGNQTLALNYTISLFRQFGLAK